MRAVLLSVRGAEEGSDGSYRPAAAALAYQLLCGLGRRTESTCQVRFQRMVSGTATLWAWQNQYQERWSR
jgi:hypothetical protein